MSTIVTGLNWVVPPVELTARTKAAFYQTVQAALSNSNRDIVVDLGVVEKIDSLGLGALVAAYREVHNQRGTLVLYAPQPSLYQRLQMTRLTKLMPVYQSHAALIARHSQPRNWPAAGYQRPAPAHQWTGPSPKAS